MHAEKTFLHDTLDYLSHFDIVLLCETRCFVLPEDFLPLFDTFHVPASSSGKAGEGLLISVRRSLKVAVNILAEDSSSIWLSLTSANFQRPLVVASCYIPPQGSHQLHDYTLDQRLEVLQRHVQIALRSGNIILAGDFNARVAGLTDEYEARLQARGFTDPVINSHGRRLLNFCQENGLYLSTGRTAGDKQAQASYKARQDTQASRLDHFIAAHANTFDLLHSSVDTSRHDSDHFPVQMVVNLPCIDRAGLHFDGELLPRHHWKAESRMAYVDSLGDVRLDGANGDTKTQSFLTQIGRAAKMAMMPNRRFQPTGQPKPRKPFYDQECQRMKRAISLHRRTRGQGPMLRKLEREYHAHTRAKRRAFERQTLDNLLEAQYSEPRKFWKHLRKRHRQLPIQLQSVSAWDLYLHKLARPCLPQGSCLPYEAYPQRPFDKAACLNQPISLGEIEMHLKQLHNGRACGKTGHVSELLRYAVKPPTPENPQPRHKLIRALHDLLNAFLDEGKVPCALNHALVTPVYKKGDRNDCSNYRPIAVTEPIMRLYTGILNTRLLEFTETTEARASAQAGFRPQHSTLHPLFTLQHFIHKQFHAKASLFCCFLDLKSAYDSVQRPLLWAVLAKLGVHGKMLSALQSLYTESTISINLSGRTGRSFTPEAGVKQGCPLSPTLFGFFLDGLQRYLIVNCPTVGPGLSNGNYVPCLMYADDIALMATTASELQVLIDATHAFCDSVGLTISPAKSSVVVFSKLIVHAPVFSCHNGAIPQVEQAKYLGLVFHWQYGILCACEPLLNKMTAAWAVLSRQYAGMRCAVSVSLVLQLYKACVPPVASYGCEIWSQLALPQAIKKHRDSLGQKHNQILCSIAGLRSTTSRDVLFRELEELPLNYLWLLRTVTFWNNLAALPDNNLFKTVALDNCRDAIVHRIKNWSWAVHHQLQAVGYVFSLDHTDLQPLGKQPVHHLLEDKLQVAFEGLDICPRTGSSHGHALCKYQNWFASPAFETRRLLSVNVGASLLRAFLRFRCGCHGLPVDSGRFSGIQRSQRLCLKCNGGFCCDEYHVIFECQALQHLRAKYSHLFLGQASTMRQFMWQEDIKAVMLFVREALACLLS